MNDPQRNRTTVTLEDLLRVKRAERPPAEFWVEFERTLRAKQLAAIVEKRPWWQSWRSVWRLGLPTGAAAALAFGVASFYLGRTASYTERGAQPIASATQAPRSPSVATLEAVETAVVEPQAAPLLASASTEALPTPADDLSHSPSGVEVASAAADHAASRALPTPDLDERASFASASLREESTLADLSLFFERAVASVDERGHLRQPVQDPLAQVPSPQDARRARLLAFASTVDRNSPQYSDASNVIRSRERITNHLNDEALYDSIRRLGVRGNGVSIQF